MKNQNIRQYAPVVVFAYNRPNHLRDTLEALNRCYNAEESNIYIFCDGPKTIVTPEMIEVQKVVKEFEIISRFNMTKSYISEVNKGLASSVIEGVTSIIEEYGRVIVLEDDLICSPNFLLFMNQALEYYCDNEQIWSISGYIFRTNLVKMIEKDVLFMGRASSWGWATWENRWKTIDWEVKDYSHFKYNIIKRLKFAKWGRDLPIMLDQQVNANINSWAIRWVYEQSKQNKYSVYPVRSLIENKGADGSGEHKSNTDAFSTVMDSGDKKIFKFEEPYLEKSIEKACRKQYGFSTEVFVKVFLKNLLIRLGVIK